jgi:hypothetical protein
MEGFLRQPVVVHGVRVDGALSESAVERAGKVAYK